MMHFWASKGSGKIAAVHPKPAFIVHPDITRQPSRDYPKDFSYFSSTCEEETTPVPDPVDPRMRF
jgi:hypothetical protein